MSYQFVEQLHKKAVPVERLCRVLGVSRSGYYGARQRAKLAPKACLVSTQLKAEFAASGKVYGSRRLGAVLRAQGLRIGRHRVRRLMRENRLRALWRRKFVHTTDSGHALPVSANLLARRFDPSGPNQAWVSDITYIRTRSGWLYLAVVWTNGGVGPVRPQSRGLGDGADHARRTGLCRVAIGHRAATTRAWTDCSFG
jgi:putative transposase